MKCPICVVDLLVADRQGIEVDYCPTCRGVWLDRRELDKLISRAAGAASPHLWKSIHDDSDVDYPAQYRPKEDLTRIIREKSEVRFSASYLTSVDHRSHWRQHGSSNESRC